MGVNVVNAQPAKARRLDPQRSTPGVASQVARFSAGSPIHQLQRAVGNRAMNSLLSSPIIQPKLTVSQPGDPYEREADRVADQVMRMPESSSDEIHRSPGNIQRICHECEREKDEEPDVLWMKPEGGLTDKAQAMRKASAAVNGPEEMTGLEKDEIVSRAKSAMDNSHEVFNDFESNLQNTRGGGQPLLPSTRAFFEPRFGHDFSQVRVHSDSRATEAAHEIRAQAFTVGADVYFASGRYDPSSNTGRRLLSHELTHVVQQGYSNPPARIPADSHSATLSSEHQVTQSPNGQHRSADILPRIEPTKAVQISPVVSPYIQREPASGVAKAAIRQALRWLGRRGATITRHVARHTRPIANRALHTIFRKPNQVKKLVQRALSAPDNVLVQSGRRVRYVIEKEFGRVIGKNGETILHVVIEASGKVITAYPVRAFTAASVALIIVDEASAEARAELEGLDNRARRAMERAEPSFWGDLVRDFVTFGLYGGELNAGEDIELWVRRETNEILQRTYENVIRDIEEAEQATLGPEARTYILDLVSVGLTDPHALDELESQAPEGE